MTDRVGGEKHVEAPLDLDDQGWGKHVNAVKMRETAVLEVAKHLSGSKIVAAKEISSTDLFVQKAGDDLGVRSDLMKRYAKYCIFAFFSAIVVFFALYYVAYEQFFMINFTNSKIATQLLVAGVAKNATFIGIFLGNQYIVVSLYRAFLHESMTLDNRIHSLRLGRLYIYLKYSSTSEYDMMKVRDSISAQDLERVFGWNIETSTAFKDINPEVVSKSIWSNIPELIGAIRGKK